MRLTRFIPVLAAAGLLLIGVGATIAIADDNAPATDPEACVVVTPGNAPAQAADAVGEAAQDVNTEAKSEEADDDQGDVEEADGQNNQSGEQGDCENDNHEDGD